MKQLSIENQVREATKSIINTKQIARWKLVNGFERWLSYLADNSHFWKKMYVLYYKLFDRKYYKAGLNAIYREIKAFNGDIDEKQKRVLRDDMVYSLHRFGAMFTEYFLFNFPHLNTLGREAFVTDKMRYVYCEILNPTENIHLFDNKNETYKLFKKYYGREVLYISTNDDLEKFSDFVSRNSTFIKKPVHNGGGRGVMVLSINEFESVSKIFEQLLVNGPFIIEEIVNNYHSIRNIYPNALSTIRIPTIRTKEGTEIFTCFIRFGRGGGVVDNVASGGIGAIVDINSGIVETPAYDRMGNKYIVHPDTSESIVGFKIPMWDGAKSLVKELSEVVPSNRYIGWDLALTDNGWIMVEGNARGEFYGLQCIDKIGKKDWLEYLILK